jgi:hypothetical protein
MARPRTIETPEEFDRLVDEYAEECRGNKEPMAMSGLAFVLGFASRQSFYDYEKDPAFTRSVRRAKLLVEWQCEKRCHESAQAAGPIFLLKNFGWTDKQVVEHEGEIGVPGLTMVVKRGAED